MSNRTYTDDELILRVWDVEEIKKLANKRVYYQINGWREKEMDELWTKEHADTASFGENTGFYTGLDSVKKWYIACAPSGNGTLVQHPISTGLVELAGDGKTAKGLWYSIGQETVPGKAMWVTGKIGIDFVKEGDAWKIWHVMEANDLTGSAGADYAQGTPYWEPENDPVVQSFGTPDIEILTHDPNFNWWDNYPSMPQPYDSWSDEISYGPEGYQPDPNKGFNAKEGGNY